MTSKNKDDLIMKILKDMNMPISRPAVMIMLEDGMLTEERPFKEYICAKNIYDALCNPNIPVKEVLSRGLDDETSSKLVDLFTRYF